MSDKNTEYLMNRLYNWLLKNHPKNIAVPLVENKKNPIPKHKNDVWTWDDVKSNNTRFLNFGILLKTLIVFDFDSQDLAEKYEDKFPVLKNAPAESTKKGMHYFFLRSTVCDAMNIYDKSRFMGINADKIDIKTICSTGTSGVLAVCPSPNKKWVRPLWEYPLIELNGDLLKFVIDNYDRKHKVERISKTKYISNEIPNPTDVLPLVSCPTEREFYDRCIDLLGPERAKAYESWIRSGWCFRNLTGNDVEYTDSMKYKWIDFSKKCVEKFDMVECKYMWGNIVPRNGEDALGPKSLMAWAKEDDPAEYFNARILYHGYNAVRDKFEKTHCKIMRPVIFIEKTEDEEIIMRSRKELLDTYENMKYEMLISDEKNNNIKKEVFVKRWLRDENMRTYKKMDNLPPPMKCKDTIFNLWNGFDIERLTFYEERSIQPYLDHLQYICNYDQYCVDYFLDFIAQIIQFPGKPVGIAIAFIGPQGIGKNLLLDFIVNMLTDKLACQTNDPESDIYSRFSNGYSNRLLMVINEANGRDGYKYSDKLKDIITAPTLRFEEKGKNPLNINNFLRLLFTSNNRYIINIEQDDRRFVIIETTGEKKDKLYYKDLAIYVEDVNNQRCFYEFLKLRNIDESKLRYERPETEIYNDLKQFNLPLLTKYFIHKSDNEKKDKTIKLTATQFLNDFNEFVENDEKIMNGKMKGTKFGIELKKYLIENNGFIEKIHEVSGNVYRFEIETLNNWLTNKNYKTRCLL